MDEYIFKLIATYEFLVEVCAVKQPLRIEIFESIKNDNFLRARIWIQNIYNLYPTLLNTDNEGMDTHNLYSSDQINMEITSIISEDENIILGKQYDSEEEFREYLTARINWYINVINNKVSTRRLD